MKKRKLINVIWNETYCIAVLGFFHITIIIIFLRMCVDTGWYRVGIHYWKAKRCIRLAPSTRCPLPGAIPSTRCRSRVFLRGSIQNQRITPLQNWSKYNKSLFKEEMVYMNLEDNWSLATPLTGLGCACSYYEIFSAKFTNFFNKKITGLILKNDHLCHLHF